MREYISALRDCLSLLCLRAAASLTTWGDSYDKIIEALEEQRRHSGLGR